MQNRKIEILGALMDLGASRRGVSLGPAAIRFAGIVEGLRAMGLEVDDLGDVIFPPEGKSLENMRNYEQVVEIASAGTAGIHLSYDVDAISPEFAPGTGTTVHSGLTVREAFTIAEMLAESKKLIAMDLVEVNPILDERNRTASLGSELVQSALGKAVF